MLRLINIIFNVLEYAILIEVILSWVYVGRTNQYIEILHKITGPLLQPGRKIQERYFSNTMIDFSPIIALAIIMVAKRILVAIL
ncbi:YggT family protein [Clostridium bowmanii]|uniref:YggT family protein n=1 Tax=Clostridium bowmanii TaxID=132925 RepID=UPI001C0BF6FA|nr:YggT family protein [Clostridium bowmanii]MBU3190540.1 YggT family protein [Clostridium bowmanii]MCA1075071.1 YggT family protein [Clostridium bowmanii]